MHIVLFEPEIPQNTGNIARLCAATGTELHLVEPLGFKLENCCLKRAGLDYWPHVRLFAWPDWQAYTAAVGHSRAVMTSAKGGCPVQHFVFEAGDSLIFEPETRGLPPEILAASPWKTRIPMCEGRCTQPESFHRCRRRALYGALPLWMPRELDVN